MPRVTREICLFCSRPATSGEHIFSDGLKDLFPKRQKHSRFATVTANYKSDGDAVAITNQTRRPHKGIPNAVKHYVVCGDCNNGWMSRLERRTQPLLRRLIQGKPVKIDRRAQKRLARWFALKVAIHECGCDNPPTVPVADLAVIRRNGRLPDHWHIWIACTDVEREPGSAYNLASIPVPVGSDGKVFKLYGSSTVLVGGRLVLFAFVIPGLRFQNSFARFGDLLQPVFPPAKPIVWPPEKHAGRKVLLQLAQAVSIAMENTRLPDEFIGEGED
jgi:hypothetical protein